MRINGQRKGSPGSSIMRTTCIALWCAPQFPNFHFVLMHQEFLVLPFLFFSFRGFQNTEFSPPSFSPYYLNFLHTDFWYWYLTAQFSSFCKLVFLFSLFFRCFTTSPHENWDEGVCQIHNSSTEFYFISLNFTFYFFLSPRDESWNILRFFSIFFMI